MDQLVLSLFPGCGMLDMAFEELGFCVVRGPDLLLGGDVKKFHAPADRFDGIIGGPPCQQFSTLARLNKAQGKTIAENLIPEYNRIVNQASPRWFLMENVEAAPLPECWGYDVESQIIVDCEVGGVTTRKRRFSFGSVYAEQPFHVQPVIPFPAKPQRAVTTDARLGSVGGRIRANKRGSGMAPNEGPLMPFADMLAAQGLPADYLSHSAFTQSAKRKMIGNGVPLAMGRAVAAAVVEALGLEATQDVSSLTEEKRTNCDRRQNLNHGG